MTPRDHILEKVKKLLRLAKSDNPAEAAAAMAKAMEIATAHAIEIGDLNPDDETEAFIYAAVGGHNKRMPLDHTLAHSIVVTAFQVEWITCTSSDGKCVNYLGRPAAVELATWAFNYLVTAHRRGRATWKADMGRYGRTFARREQGRYTSGFFYGVMQTIQEQKNAQAAQLGTHALVVLDQEKERREAFIKGQGIPEAKKARPLNLKTPIAAGLADGRAIRITNRALDCAPEGKLQLTAQ